MSSIANKKKWYYNRSSLPELCNEQNVGETGGPLNRRMNGHRSDLTKGYFERSHTVMHCHLSQHDFTTMAVCGMEMNHNWTIRSNVIHLRLIGSTDFARDE